LPRNPVEESYRCNSKNQRASEPWRIQSEFGEREPGRHNHRPSHNKATECRQHESGEPKHDTSGSQAAANEEDSGDYRENVEAGMIRQASEDAVEHQSDVEQSDNDQSLTHPPQS